MTSSICRSGDVRFKFAGGAGGHNGLRDTITHLGADFWRLRLGIGHPGDKSEVIDYVLRRAPKDEEECLLEAVGEALATLAGVPRAGRRARHERFAREGLDKSVGYQVSDIVGLPNVGKSTLFNALTRAQIAAENYPFCTIDPNVGVVPVPDPRLDVLAGIVKPARILPATVEFVDIAGLVAGASKGEGLGNQFLSHIRETDAIAHVVRCFEDDDIVHVAGRIKPLDDIEVINTELALADLDTVERGLQRAEKAAKAGDKDAIRQRDLLKKLREHLDAGKPARSLDQGSRGAPAAAGAAPDHAQAAHVRRERRRGRLQEQSASRRRAPARRRGELRSRRGVRGDRSGDRAARRSRSRGLPAGARARRARAESRDPRRLQAARAADLLHRGPEGSARLDRAHRRDRAASRRRDPHRLRERLHSRRGDRLRRLRRRTRASRARRKPASCGSKARSTSSRKATSCTSASTSEGAGVAVRDFDIRDERFRQCIRTSANIERLHTGCRWTEGRSTSRRCARCSSATFRTIVCCASTSSPEQSASSASRPTTPTATQSIGKVGSCRASRERDAWCARSTTARSPCSPIASRVSASTARTTSW